MLFHARLLDKFTSHICFKQNFERHELKRETSNQFSYKQGVREILKFSRNERQNSDDGSRMPQEANYASRCFVNSRITLATL